MGLIEENPWFVQLRYSFQDSKFLYLVTDFCAGGDFMELLIRKEIIPNHEAKFYMAELATAINEIHKMNFVHRDLKPDNILIDARGHLKLTDFGLCKTFFVRDEHADGEIENLIDAVENLKVDQLLDKDQFTDKYNQKVRKRSKMDSIVGTTDYMAPEIFRRNGYGKEVDWWAFGAIMFESVCGYAPFHVKDKKQTCMRILNYRHTLRFPTRLRVNPFAKKLIQSILTNTEDRMTFEQIKTHQWFDTINWDKLQEMDAPYIPNISCDTDTVHFDNFGPSTCFQNALPTPGSAIQKHFRGFTYDHGKSEDLRNTPLTPQLIQELNSM